MYISNSMTHNFGGFTLDLAGIGNTSTSKTEIVLPYTGPLPAALSDAASAAINITLRVGLAVSVLLTVERAEKVYHYPVEATPEEIKQILRGFFFTANGYTRHDNGLERYSLGLHQGSYINWERIVVDTCGASGILDQLSPAALKDVQEYICFITTA